MSLRIPIDHKKLTDSPYSSSTQSFFSFSKSDSHDFVQDIVHGNPTCYLISGYRGAGKSSFIKKLEEEIVLKASNTLFVPLNFAKHEPKAILLRRLIRSFYLRLVDSEALHKTLKDNLNLTDTLSDFQELYDRTFFEVSKNSNVKNTKLVKASWEFKANVAEIATVVMGWIGVISLSNSLNLTSWVSYIPILIAAIGGVLPFWSLFTRTKLDEEQNEETNEHSKSQLYDDEIAEYSLIKVLSSLRQHVKPVFILDELDKVANDELVEEIINELKPVMLSGLASFIVVAGQNLYYSYYAAQGKDDNPLSSLFSKDHHVPLPSPSELRILFNKLIREDANTQTDDEKKLVDAYVSYLIFASKRIPRRFVSLIRRNLIWEGEVAYLEISQQLPALEIYSQVLQSAESIQNNMISAEGYPSAIADYLSMQLLLKLDAIVNKRKAITE